MTQLSIDRIPGTNQIQSYDSHGIKVDGVLHPNSIIISENRFEAWSPLSLEDLNLTHLDELLTSRDIIVILGLGPKSIAPPISLLAKFFEKKIPIEWMDSASACRTYQLLRSEERPVIAGILLK